MEPEYGRPRSFCDKPSEFGRSEDVTFEKRPFPDPKQSMSLNTRVHLARLAGEARAAAIQHEIALGINTILTIDCMTHAACGKLNGLTERRIGSVLPGERRIYLQEVEQAKSALPGLDALLRVVARRARLARTNLDELCVPLNGYHYIAYQLSERSSRDSG